MSELALYDIANVAGVGVDVGHINTKATVKVGTPVSRTGLLSGCLLALYGTGCIGRGVDGCRLGGDPGRRAKETRNASTGVVRCDRVHLTCLV